MCGDVCVAVSPRKGWETNWYHQRHLSLIGTKQAQKGRCSQPRGSGPAKPAAGEEQVVIHEGSEAQHRSALRLAFPPHKSLGRKQRPHRLIHEHPLARRQLYHREAGAQQPPERHAPQEPPNMRPVIHSADSGCAVDEVYPEDPCKVLDAAVAPFAENIPVEDQKCKERACHAENRSRSAHRRVRRHHVAERVPRNPRPQVYRRQPRVPSHVLVCGPDVVETVRVHRQVDLHMRRVCV
mmetsp:Transcript_42364/g.135659  ORF Transcript_42364/g.135659 Transcript_42364/m.135659 type:complete len:238 (-) Transcript_42364:632-1345(-)